MPIKSRIIAKPLRAVSVGPRGRIIVLTGARQTGKSTLLKGLFRDYQYVNLDDPLVRSQYLDQSYASLARFFPKAIWDEVQKAPDLVEKIKAAYDSDPATRFILSGSSQILLLRNVRETLAGRAALFNLFPLTIPEVLADSDALDGEVGASRLVQSAASLSEGASPSEIFKNLRPMMPDQAAFVDAEAAFEEYLKHGGMPFLSTPGLTQDDKRSWLRDYVRTYLQRDLADLSQLNNLEPFFKAEKLLAIRTGTLLNFSEAARTVGISIDSMRRYMTYLEISFQAFLLPSWQRNPAKHLTKTPRVHFLDPGICRALTGNFESTDGGLFESAVCAEIYKQVQYAFPDWSLHHLRTADGREVDLLIETPRGYIALEIKMAATAAQSQTRHFRGLEGLLDKPLLGGFLLTQDKNQRYFPETNTLALPAFIALAPGP